MIGDGIIWDKDEREAEETAKAEDQWNSLAEEHQRALAENDRLSCIANRLRSALVGMVTVFGMDAETAVEKAALAEAEVALQSAKQKEPA